MPVPYHLDESDSDSIVSLTNRFSSDLYFLSMLGRQSELNSNGAGVILKRLSVNKEKPTTGPKI